MMGSMMATTWTDVAAAISASVLDKDKRRLVNVSVSRRLRRAPQSTYPSVCAHSRLGPRTMAMLLGVILLTSLSWASLDRNFTRYLQHSPAWLCVESQTLPL